MTKKIIFHEKQKFRQPWIWIGLFAFLLIQLYGLVQQIFFNIPFGNKPASNLTFIIIFILYIGLMFLFKIINLNVEIREDIYIRFYPLQKSFTKISIKDIKKYYIRTYNPIVDYGGWGIRYGLRSRGLVYNVSGNKGVQLELFNGKLILIGSQNSEKLKNAIESIKKN